MFKYVWLVAIVVILIGWAIISVVDLVQSIMKNYNWYVKKQNGNWADVFWNIHVSESTAIFFISLACGIFAGSFISFILHVKELGGMHE